MAWGETVSYERPAEVPQPKSRGVKSAGKGLNPQWNSDAYRSNPFWERVEKQRKREQVK